MHDHRRLLIALAALGALLLALAAAGCSDSGGSSGGDGSGSAGASGGGEPVPEDEKLAVGWVFAGPRDAALIGAVEQAFPDRIQSSVADNAGADGLAGAASSLATQGARLIIVAGPGGCSSVSEVHCVEADSGTEPAANVATYGSASWNTAFLLGKVAGFLTESDNVGFVARDATPQQKAAVNTWALGCQSSNPNCVTRLAVASTGDAGKAVKKLLKSGADVVATTSEDASICAPAEKAKVPVVGVPPARAPCSDPIVRLDLAPALEKEVEAELAGNWAGARRIALDGGALTFAGGVPADVETKVEKAAEQLAGGKKVFVGPLFDNQGEQRVPEGEELTPEFIASQWNWLLGGVLEQ